MSSNHGASELPALTTPIASTERIQALDVVRGFALIGIFLMNVEFFNRPLQEIGQGLPAGATGLDWLAGFLVYVLVQGKFWTMFSLLFGMGFAVMLSRAERAGRNFMRPYLRRIAALAVFGVLHNIFIWGGDILFSYSVAAVGLLIVLYGRTAPILAAMGFLLVVGILGAMDVVPQGTAAFQVLVGLMFMGIAALYLRSEGRSRFLGKSWLSFSIPFLVLGVLAALAAIAFVFIPGPLGEAKVPVAIFAGVLLLIAWASDHYHDPAEPRMRRLGAGLYLFPFVMMLLFGIAQLVMGPRPPPPGGDAALVAVRAEAAAADAAGREWPAKEKPGKKNASRDESTKPGAAGSGADPAYAWARGKVEGERYRAESARDIAEERRIESGGTYLEAVRFRAGKLAENAPNEANFGIILVGMFLLGAWFVRSGVMEDTGAHLPLFRKLALVGIPVGVGLGLVGAAIDTSASPGVPGDPYQVAQGLMYIGNLPACLGYVGVIVLMLHSASALQRVRVLAPLGRMALTNYLTHSLLGTWFFYGYGLGQWGMGRASQVAFVAAVIVLQILFCHWWLSKFRYGPMEWLWRAITYWQLPPMRRGVEPTLEARAAA